MIMYRNFVNFGLSQSVDIIIIVTCMISWQTHQKHDVHNIEEEVE